MNARAEKILNLPVYQRFILVVLIMLILVAGFYFLIYKTQIEEYDRLENQRQASQTLLVKNQKIANNFEVYKAEFEIMQKQLEQALGELPMQQEIPRLLTSIADLAREKGLDILRFKPQPEQVQGFYAEVPVDLKLVGSFHEAAVFFDSVSHMERIVNIRELSLQNPIRTGGKTSVDVTCQAVTYRFVENAEPATAENKKSGGKKK